MRALLLPTLLLFTGCAWDAGEGFAVLEPSMRAAYTPLPSREAGDGYQKLSSDYQVRVTAAQLRLARIELLGRAGEGGLIRFDPANPPPGYTICHNGHCDREDGVLVPYEEVAAELGGGGLAPSIVATLPVGEVDLLAPETQALECEPDCELPRTAISNGRWTLAALRLEGTVRDGRATPRFPGERPFRLALPASGTPSEPVAVITGALDVPSDRRHEPRVMLELLLDVTPVIFDPVDWAGTTPGPDGSVDLGTETHRAARTLLLRSLSELTPVAEVKREER
jgi:hypothetical protein